ncbi:right-handed parallel beta-helix repeat-containing protein [Burkholderia cepacia]|uniref:Right-handed parallel beta-helix repeat-containing protein n=2 Tax=Burkholderia cepacia TaxID=292 RepID=A0A8I1DPV0_BURCE|nr:right-handed parallel beta-helix repeat-containing protein [Burkholderia cepacia]MBA9901746.1 right-handed parallel beta-helix repeat-containing protein [Burkholderia cepacia]MBA9948629.1 right-handed parallel beta-helix repeat-containing protein [Burkholderia cepacia]MBA9978922.1 right-handed parallel beta-helix repeat-containing protein [Burkholderia cepacia]MBA9997596.1 right-handed parallel beta-helix repeat-containing protein [Burkholderia cepacia]MBB0005607.1 right-handed parallel bet
MHGSRCQSRAYAVIAGILMAGGLMWPGIVVAASDVSASGALHANVPDAYVYPAPGRADQADELQRVLDGLRPWQRLVFAPGRYVIGRSLIVRRPNVVLSGYGATLMATRPGDQTVEMRGDGTTLIGFRLRGTGTTRLATRESTKVEVTGHDVQVLDNVIEGGASAGIFVFGGSDVAIVGNEVLSTLADGIHVTHGARDVLVQGNVVRDTGDDMIAVVSYRGDGVLSRNVFITRNSLEGNTWGRGITVVGGADVTISNNVVRNVQVSSGILVAQEDSFQTYGASGVRIENNIIANIQTVTGRTDPRPLTQQAAIEVSTWSGTVTQVAVIGNRVSQARFDGIRVWGNVSGVRLADNQLSGIGGMPVRVGPKQDCAVGDAKAEPCAMALQTRLVTPDVVGADTSLLPRVREFAWQPR